MRYQTCVTELRHERHLVNGDAFSGSLIRVPGETAGNYPVLIGSLSAGSNYLLTYIGSSLTIAPVEQPAIPVINNSPVIESAEFGVYPSSFVSDNAPGYGDYGFGSYAVGSNDYGFSSDTLGNNEYAFVSGALVDDGNASATTYHGKDPDESSCTPVGIWKRLNRYNRIDLIGGNSAICK